MIIMKFKINVDGKDYECERIITKKSKEFIQEIYVNGSHKLDETLYMEGDFCVDKQMQFNAEQIAKSLIYTINS
jgi:hypothetical protein